ncbi:MAG: hypothetical protein RI947_202 [Candidatus Parcubacteria bacterium]|jgi:DNA polymerase-3 subunit gamma/tau
MYYLKYRPHTIKEIDNEKARNSITNVIKSAQLPHAFLFIGQKGTGKTSTARIFAKAVNCLNNHFAGTSDSIDPCNECKNCLSIDSSSSTDVTELDAASNRGIDEIRSLIKDASFAPMSGRYRVFIIDEAHMITNDAFNALLKTLEEPPESVIFILATTNEEKIPATIGSRCFRVEFGKADRADVLKMLHRIVKGEKIQVPEETLELISRHSDKSFRDATKLLEELVMQNTLTTEAAQQYLGLRSQDSLLIIMQSKPLKDALQWIDEFGKTGGSFKVLIEKLLQDLRDGMLKKNGIAVDSDVELSFSTSDISMFMKLLQEAYTLLRTTPIDSIPLEIAVVEFYNKKK